MSAETIFDSTQDTLENILKEAGSGRLQLPDFQRGWVWDDAHIKSLIASVSRSFPIGAVMTLRTGGDVRFQPRPIQGIVFGGPAPEPERLILDGQQRLTSLYQALILPGAIKTKDEKSKVVRRRYYVDMRKAVQGPQVREEAIVSVPEDGRIVGAFGRNVSLDVSTPENEYKEAHFPLEQIFCAHQWRREWSRYWDRDAEMMELWDEFEENFIHTFRSYQIPIIELRHNASKEAVCVVFEKVNTGGVPLTAFELLTATFAADNFNLREDWYGVKRDSRNPGRAARMAKDHPILLELKNTDFLQAVCLLHTRQRREQARRDHGKPHDLPAVSCTRQTMLNLPLEGYQRHANRAEEGFCRAAHFLWREKIFSLRDIPYRTQLVPLAAILASLEDQWENDTYRQKIRQWFWCGIFGELYGSAIESRFANDLNEVLDWLTADGPVPATVEDSYFMSDRLASLRNRNSAAYKGLHALIMQEGGALDWRTGAGIDEQTYFRQNVDIHHIFPKAWCAKPENDIHPDIYNSIVNKTPLSAQTNRLLGSKAPSSYLPRLQEKEGISATRVNKFLESHLIDPKRLRDDDIEGMLIKRGAKLLKLIETATGRKTEGTPLKEIFDITSGPDDVEDDEDDLVTPEYSEVA